MSRVMPYSPLHEPQKSVSEDRMREILSKNSAKAAQSPKEKSQQSLWPTAQKGNGLPAQPPRAAGKLEWADREPGSMGRYSKCHWYSVCQVSNGEQVSFQAWTRNPLTQGMRILEIGLPTFKAAIAVCQKGADEHYARGER